MIPCSTSEVEKTPLLCGSNLPSDNNKDFFYLHSTLNYKCLILTGLKTFVVTSSTASSAPRYQQGACQRAAAACVTSFFEVALHALKHHQEKEIREAVFNLVRLLIFNTSASTLQSSPDTC